MTKAKLSKARDLLKELVDEYPQTKACSSKDHEELNRLLDAMRVIERKMQK